MVKIKSHKKRPLFFWMLLVVTPGLIISGFGLLSISQQEKTKVLKIQEKYVKDLEFIRNEVKNEIESAVESSFQQISKSQTQLNQADHIQKALKEILLKNPIVKYPFLIDSRGVFIFPISKKNPIPVVELPFPRIAKKKIQTYYREGEGFEFGERKIWEALKSYVKCLKYRNIEPLKPYIFNSIARCYFKLGKYPQALSYYQSIIDLYSQVLPADRNFSIYFPALRQMARSYQQMGWQGNTLEMYLRLYDEILQYETSILSDKFAFFKNEALEYLNQHVQIRQQNKEKEQPDEIREPDRLREFAGPEISLRWQYFEYGDFSSKNNINDSIHSLGEREDEEQKNKDILRFMKIQEFYLAADEKTQFYRTVKDMKKWGKKGDAGTSIREMEMKRIRNPVSNDTSDVVFKRLVGNIPGFQSEPRRVFFGFMLFTEFINSARVLDIFKKYIREPGLRVLVISSKNQERQSVKDRLHPFILLSVNFEKYFIDKALVLVSSEENYFTQQARNEIRLNYLLITAFIMALILGVYLFYKYLSREAELVRLKSEFADSASHTLKTPLTRIRMLAEKLQLGWVSSDSNKQEYLHTILLETDRMNEMIINMLDFSKIEAGRKYYNFVETSLAEVVKEALESYTDYIQNLGFELHAEIDDSIPLFSIDADAIRLIVVNLLQNAIKYSIEEKFIGVRLYGEKENVVLEVVDKGMGIEEKDVKKIFGRFYRASDNSVQMVEGSGLGLFLVQHAVQAHKGEINVFSQPGKGSRFKVLLPFRSRESF